ncbi:hypothetical protein Q7P37_000061 [Cladosporium fusiforme]
MLLHNLHPNLTIDGGPTATASSAFSSILPTPASPKIPTTPAAAKVPILIPYETAFLGVPQSPTANTPETFVSWNDWEVLKQHTLGSTSSPSCEAKRPLMSMRGAAV